MSDLISRRAAIDLLKVAYWDESIQSAKDDPCIVDAMIDWVIRKIKGLPTADVPDRKVGKWVKAGQSFFNPNRFRNYFCSVCLYDIEKTKYNYCPNCGADMRERKDDESHPFADDVMMGWKDDER